LGNHNLLIFGKQRKAMMEAYVNSGALGTYGEEIISGAKVVGIPVGTAVLLNLIYEVEAGCTSIIYQSQNGQLYHGRNLDFNLHKVLSDLTIQVEFQKSGKTIYRGTTFVGYVGLLTGCSDTICVSVDERDTGYPWDNVIQWIYKSNSSVTAFLLRDQLERGAGFEDAIGVLSTTPLIAPVYYIVSGNSSSQGAIIARDRDWSSIRKLGDSQKSDGSWYLCETNYDWDKPDKDGRRTAAEKMMDSIGQKNMTKDGLFTIVSTPPVLAKSTTYTTMMSAGQQLYETVVRRS